MRKRNFLKNTYTIARRQHITDDVATDDYMYIRGRGLISPSPSVATVQADETSFDLNHEILCKTRQDYPCLDNINGDNTDYGLYYYPDVVVWTNRPYIAYSQDLFVQQGKDIQRQVTLIYDGSDAGWRDAELKSLDWDEIEAFQYAVNSTENVLELITSKVL